MSGSKYTAPIDFRIPSQANPSLEPAIRNALEEVYISLQVIARTLVNYAGIGQQNGSAWSLLSGDPRTILSGNMRRFYAKALENMNQYELVSWFDTGAGMEMRLADATDNTKIAIGYCNAPNGLVVGQIGEFILNLGVPSYAGLVPGAPYWLSTTPGTITNVPPVAAGNVEQFVGIAFNDTQLNFTCMGYIQH